VVFIQVEGQSRENFSADARDRGAWPFNDDLFSRFFGDDFPGLQRRKPGKPRREINQGSGFAFAAQKDVTYLLTNSHVVENAARIRVKLHDGREFNARLKATDPKSDIAVLEISSRDLPILNLGDSSRLEVGEWVVALGNPLGLSHTLTAGVVSATGRTSLGINDYEDFIQTDAAINPGNSGGPLLNLDGEVVGMNTAIFSKSGGHMGVGFAIPSNLVRVIADQILASGNVVRGYIGLAVQPLDADLMQALNLDGEVVGMNTAIFSKSGGHIGVGFAIPSNLVRVIADQILASGNVVRGYIGLAVQPLDADLMQALNLDSHRGVLVNQVNPDSPAERAGIQPGDVLVSFNAAPLSDGGHYRNQAALAKPGSRVTLGVLREGRSLTLPVEVGLLNELANQRAEAAQSVGLVVRALTADESRRLRNLRAVVVVSVDRGSLAAMAGMQPGTVILEANRKPVTSQAEFLAALGDSEGSVLLRLLENGSSRFMTLRWR
jgi:serine protease Do